MESERNFSFCKSSILGVRNLFPVDFRIRLLGQISIKIERSLNLGFRILQTPNQKRLERNVQIPILFFPASKTIISFLDKNGLRRLVYNKTFMTTKN